MINFFRKQKLAVIIWVYWFLLLYIIAALVWWFISLENQNDQMYNYRVVELKKDDPEYISKLDFLNERRKLKSEQYVGEGATFLFLICVGAVFVYGAARKQIRLSRQQNNFMTAVTHELKTPVAIAQLNLETLQKRKLDDGQQQKLVGNTIKEMKRLNMLTNNILVASQFETGGYDAGKHEMDLSEMVQQCAKSFTENFSQRNITSNIEADIFVLGENLLLQMMANNLIDNALKYTPKTAAVNIILIKKNGLAILQIIDEGNGIADAEKKIIFEKFYRSGSESTRVAKGTGLGLYLCKKIADGHKGKITVTDNVPHGSIFTFTMQSK